MNDHSFQEDRRKKELEEMTALRDKINKLEQEKGRLEKELTQINSSRLYRLLRVTADSLASRKGIIRLPIEYRKIIRQKNGSAGAEKPKRVKYAKSKYKRNDIVRAVKERAIYIEEKSDAPLVSVIILTRDGLNNIKRLFESLTERKYYPNAEFIVVDNGSSDGTLDYLKTVSDKLRIKTIRNEGNASFSAGNNQGVEIAEGEYVVFLNTCLNNFAY